MAVPCVRRGYARQVSVACALPTWSQQQARGPAAAAAVEGAGGGHLKEKPPEVGTGAGADAAEPVAIQPGSLIPRPHEAGIHERDGFDRHAAVIDVPRE